MKFLILHPNFPAQFFYLSQYLPSNPQNQVVFLTKQGENQLPGVHKVFYQVDRSPTEKSHPFARSLEEAVLEGEAVYRKMAELKQQGFIPDVILGHTGWGSTLYMKELFPHAVLLGYCEWFYRAHGSDVAFWPEETVTPFDECRLRTLNAKFLLAMASADGLWTPTYWQHNQFPVAYSSKIQVIHEGIDTDYFCPDSQAVMQVPLASLDLSHARETITYVGRGFEPMRGFPQFMEAIEIVLKRRPQCHVVIVGRDRMAYGAPRPDGKTYKELMLERLDLDMSRVHFVGGLPMGQYRRVLQASTVHVYLTRPFVLSWSMLEAMSVGCTLVASATPPVTEVVNDRVNGLLADFRSPQDIAARIEEALIDRTLRRGLSLRARATILDRFRKEAAIAKQMQHIQSLLSRKGNF